MFLKIFVLLSVAVVAASQLAGGWSPADIKSPEVYEAAKFAVHTQFPDQHANFYVVEAQKQVVAGMKYDLIVEVARRGLPCRVDHFQVWDHFGDRSLVESEELDQRCGSPP